MLRIIFDSQQKIGLCAERKEEENVKKWRERKKHTNKQEENWMYGFLSNNEVCMKYLIVIWISNIDYNLIV